MSLDPTSPPEYLVGHIEDALARDPRVSEQGLRVAVVGDPRIVVVRGTVVSGAGKDALMEVLHEMLPGARIRDDTVVAEYPEDGTVEELP